MSYFVSKIKTIGSWTLLIGALSGCSEQNKDPNETVKQPRPAKVTTVQAAAGETLKTFPATVEPSLYAHLAFRVNGEIAELPVVAGQEVVKGQVLAKLDDKDFVVQQKQAQAKFNLTSSQFNRA